MTSTLSVLCLTEWLYVFIVSLNVLQGVFCLCTRTLIDKLIKIMIRIPITQIDAFSFALLTAVSHTHLIGKIIDALTWYVATKSRLTHNSSHKPILDTEMSSLSHRQFFCVSSSCLDQTWLSQSYLHLLKSFGKDFLLWVYEFELISENVILSN